MIKAKKIRLRRKYRSSLKYFTKKAIKLYDSIEDDSEQYDKAKLKDCISLLEQARTILDLMSLDEFYDYYTSRGLISEHSMKFILTPIYGTTEYDNLFNKVNRYPKHLKRDALLENLLTD